MLRVRAPLNRLHTPQACVGHLPCKKAFVGYVHSGSGALVCLTLSPKCRPSLVSLKGSPQYPPHKQRPGARGLPLCAQLQAQPRTQPRTPHHTEQPSASQNNGMYVSLQAKSHSRQVKHTCWYTQRPKGVCGRQLSCARHNSRAGEPPLPYGGGCVRRIGSSTGRSSGSSGVGAS